MKRMMILLGLTLLNLATTPALAEPAARCGQAEQRCALKAEATKKPAVSGTGGLLPTSWTVSGMI